MNIGDILKKVGTSIIRNVVPGGGMIVDLVNDLLPDDKKLDGTTTGQQAAEAIGTLPPEMQAGILAKQLDVQIEEIRGWSNVVDSLAQADATGNTTRPFIACLMAWAVFFTVCAFLVGFIWAVIVKDALILEAMSNAWGIMFAVLATPTALLRSYFGQRTSEKKARYAAATGLPIESGIVGFIKKLTIDRR